LASLGDISSVSGKLGSRALVMVPTQLSSREINRNSGHFLARCLPAKFEPTCFLFPTRNVDLKYVALTNSSQGLDAIGSQNMR